MQNQPIAMNFRALCLSIACLPVMASFGQNLVGNGGFEEFSDCPTYYNQVERCVGWFRATDNNDPEFHTEFLHGCNTGIFSAPSNTWGSQPPVSGVGYMALNTMSPEIFDDYRENIYTQLLAPLEVGSEYTVRFSISHTDNSQFATNNFGVKLSTSTSFPVDNSATVHFEDIITNNQGWVALSASFIANEAYTHLALGNFMTDANTTVVESCPSCPFDLYAYYLDDICLVRSGSDLCSACKDEFDPPSGILDQVDSELTVSPTLVGSGINAVHVSTTNARLSFVEVFDMEGRSVSSHQLKDTGSFNIPTNGLANGTYTISARSVDGLKRVGRFVIAR